MKSLIRDWWWLGAGLVLALTIMFAVSSCGVDSIGQHKEYVIHMNVDGRSIPCVEVRTDHGASISCDWSG